MSRPLSTYRLSSMLRVVCFRRCLLILLLGGLLGSASHAQSVGIGSKKFTENVILGEVALRAAQIEGAEATHQAEMGGTRFLWNALLKGDLDVYPEYTGTLYQEIFGGTVHDPDALADTLATLGLRMTPPLGFNNTYALGMRDDHAAALQIRTISDLSKHSTLRLGFSNEFMDRGDGWPALRAAYALPHTEVRGVDHDLAYRGLEAESIDVIDLYSTDAEIDAYGLAVLQDDRSHFPRYDALYLYRADLEDRAPAMVSRLNALAGQLPEKTMIRLNAEARLEGVPETEVAAAFVADLWGVETTVVNETRAGRLWARTLEHLWLVVLSLAAAILLAVPLGVVAAKYPRLGQGILGVVGVLYTIPSLALLVFMIPLLGIGGPPAMMALFLYSLLPIVRNTHAGLTSIAPPLLESAAALGLTAWARLRRIELPMASPSILAGVQTAAVINIGTATLGALIGAGGYGQPILTGIRLDDTALILEGAIPAALLALVAQGLFSLAGRWLVPGGLRL